MYVHVPCNWVLLMGVLGIKSMVSIMSSPRTEIILIPCGCTCNCLYRHCAQTHIHTDAYWKLTLDPSANGTVSVECWVNRNGTSRPYPQSLLQQSIEKKKKKMFLKRKGKTVICSNLIPCQPALHGLLFPSACLWVLIALHQYQH